MNTCTATINAAKSLAVSEISTHTNNASIECMVVAPDLTVRL